MAETTNIDWRELCAAAAVEQDGAKLTCLVDQIIQAFDKALPPRASSGSQLAGADN